MTSSAARPVAEDARRVGVDVVAARAVEVLEGDLAPARGPRPRLRPTSGSRPYYGAPADSSHGRAYGLRISRPRLLSRRSYAARGSDSRPGRRGRGGQRRLDRLGRDLDQAAQVAASRSPAAASARSSSPSGRMIAPRRRASSVTRWPIRSAGSCSPRSMPTMKPRPRTSATSGIRATSSSSSPSRRIFGCRRIDRALLLEGVEVGEGGRAGERVAGVGVAVEEGALLLRGAEEALVDALGRQRRRQRHVAAGQPLGEAEQVRGDAAPARRRTSSRCGRSRSRPRRRSAARRSRRRAGGPPRR